MTNLQTSNFINILPENLASQIEVQALAYAVSQQIKAVCDYADSSRIYAALDQVPEEALDILAAELRTPAYDETFSPSVKRALLEGTLTYFQKMGTPYAVNRIIEAIFGDGYIKEWFEYGGDPYHFRAYTTNPSVTQDNVAEFQRILSTVKRLSAWIDDIIIELSTDPMQVYLGHWIHTGDFIRLNRATM